MTLGSDNFADAPLIPINTYATPTPNAGLTVEGFEATEAAGSGYHKTAWWKFVIPALGGDDLWSDGSEEIRLKDITEYGPDSWEPWYYLYRDDAGTLTEINDGQEFSLYAWNVTPGDTYYLKATTWVDDPDQDFAYRFYVGNVTTGVTEYEQSPDFFSPPVENFVTQADSITATNNEWPVATSDFQASHDAALAHLQTVVGYALSTATTANIPEAFMARMNNRAYHQASVPSPTYNSYRYENEGVYIPGGFIQAVNNAPSLHNLAWPEDPPGGRVYGVEYEETGYSAWEILGLSVKAFVMQQSNNVDGAGVAEGDYPMKVDTFVRTVAAFGDGGGVVPGGSVVDSYTYPTNDGAQFHRTIEFSTGAVSSSGGVHVTMKVNVPLSLPWTDTDAFLNGNGDQVETRVGNSVLMSWRDDTNTSLGIKPFEIGATVRPPRHRWKIEYFMPPETATRLRRRPLRQFPRSDGLGMSSARRQDANRSMQASLRRGGGVYF